MVDLRLRGRLKKQLNISNKLVSNVSLASFLPKHCRNFSIVRGRQFYCHLEVVEKGATKNNCIKKLLSIARKNKLFL